MAKISKNTLWAIAVVLSIVGLAIFCFWTYYIANIAPESDFYPYKKIFLIILIILDEIFVIVIGIFIFIMVMDLNLKNYEIKQKEMKIVEKDTKIVELETELERIRNKDKQ